MPTVFPNNYFVSFVEPESTKWRKRDITFSKISFVHSTNTNQRELQVDCPSLWETISRTTSHGGKIKRNLSYDSLESCNSVIYELMVYYKVGNRENAASFILQSNERFFSSRNVILVRRRRLHFYSFIYLLLRNEIRENRRKGSG